MVVNMQETDFRALRAFMRFAAMGVMPSRERADAAVEVINTANSTLLERAREVAEGARNGVLASHAICMTACSELDRAYGQTQADIERVSAAPGGNGRG
jgi:hypothetical protein